MNARMSRSILANVSRLSGCSPVMSTAAHVVLTSHIQSQGPKRLAGPCHKCSSRQDFQPAVVHRMSFPGCKAAAARLAADTPGSARWLSNSEWRRKKDRYTLQAKEDGLRSRAAYKLKQMNQKARILTPGMTVVELGAAPGGWTVVATDLVRATRDVPWIPPPAKRAPDSPASAGPTEENSEEMNVPPAAEGAAAERAAAEVRRKGKQGRVICCDLLEMAKVRGATFVQGDFRQAAIQRKVLGLTARGEVDVVLSDMAPNTCGDAAIDHFRIMDLARQALAFSLEVLRPGGTLVVKIFNGSELHDYLSEVKTHFKAVKILKPDSSRSASSECYVHATQRIKPAQSQPPPTRTDPALQAVAAQNPKRDAAPGSQAPSLNASENPRA